MKRQLYLPARQLQKVGGFGHKLHRGYLAEDYDGIGQYILVTLTGAGTSGAVKARIAAGDFGGSRTFPEGTPVTLHSYRGQLEILDLGNKPGFCQIYFKDDVDNGWGQVFGVDENIYQPGWLIEQCGPGTDWERPVSNPAFFSVRNNAGVIDLTQNLPSDDDPWIWFDLAHDEATSKIGNSPGDAQEFLIKLRIDTPGDPLHTLAQVDFYIGDDTRLGTLGTVANVIFATIDYTTSGSAIVGPRIRVGCFGNLLSYPTIGFDGPEYVEGNLGFDVWNSDIYLRWRMERASDGRLLVEAKVWPVSGFEPDDWQAYTYIDDTNYLGSKQFIIGAYEANTFPGFTFAPVKFTFYWIRDTTKIFCRMSGNDEPPADCGGGCLEDDFARSIGPAINASWGTGGAGVWTWDGSSGVNPQGGVDGDAAFCEAPSSGSSWRQLNGLALASGDWESPPFEVLAEFNLKNPGTAAVTQQTGLELDWEDTDGLAVTGPFGALYISVDASRSTAGTLTRWRISLETLDPDFNDLDFVSVDLDPALLGQPLKARVRIENGQVMVRVWLASDAEPATWNLQQAYTGYTWDSLFASTPKFSAGLTSPQAGRSILSDLQVCLNP